MTTVIITSLNPAKIVAAEKAFKEVFPNEHFMFKGVSVPSGVADQPMSEQETKLGALTRVANAKAQYPYADYYVGLEAGIEGECTFAWMIVESLTHRGESRSASLMLPPDIVSQLHEHKELGDVMDKTFGTDNIKQKGGAISLLTNGLLTRSSVYHQALILALIPFCHPERFPANL